MWLLLLFISGGSKGLVVFGHICCVFYSTRYVITGNENKAFKKNKKNKYNAIKIKTREYNI